MHPALGRDRRPLPYTLIAVGDLARSANCVDALAPFRIGALVARDGDEALTILERFGAPTLVISDLSFPPRNGFSLVEEVRALLPKRLPIIGLSQFDALRSYAEHRKDLRLDVVMPG